MATPLRERRRQLLRDEILQAAATLLNEKGYAAMSMDELASRVGISKPTLYSHFPTKEDLMIETFMHGLDRMAEAIEADTTPRSPLRQLTFILRTVVQIRVDKGALSPRPWAPEVFQMLCAHPHVVERMRQIDASVYDMVREAQAGGEIDQSLDPATVVRVFFTLINTLHAHYLFDTILPNPSTIADTLATIFERGVRAS